MFTGVQDLCAELKVKGIEVVESSVAGDAGPASFSVIDPDGNPILFDRHV